MKTMNMRHEPPTRPPNNYLMIGTRPRSKDRHVLALRLRVLRTDLRRA